LLPVLSTHYADAAEERGRYIVLFNDSVERPGEIARAQVEQRKGSLGFVYRHGLKGYSAFLSDAAADALRNDPRVRAVRFDHPVVAASQSTPTGIDRVFATANEALFINETEDLSADVDVAVLDTGIDYEHADLEVVARTYCNGTFESASCTDGIGTDEVGHGTHVAGTIAALDNGEGVVGVAAGARLWSVKVLDPGGWESELVAGVEWVTEHASEIEVANMSIGCIFLPCSLPTMGEAIDISAEAGVVYAVAAGNNSGNAGNSTFGTNPSVITVSALADSNGQPGGKGPTSCTDDLPGDHTTRFLTDDTSASFSNYGEAIEIAAPGLCILSTYPGNEYKKASGTSMAAPHVAGAAAILAAQDNPESIGDVEAIRNAIIEEGNFGWTDTSPDGIQEPLLDVSNESVFSLTGPPTVTTKPASNLASTNATLKGTVNPNSSETTYQFEYGTTTEYGSKAPASPKSTGSGTSPVEVSEKIEGLAPETTYHFRLVATNAKGTSKGEDQTFTTTAWEILSTPNPEGASDSNLFDVSCEPSTSACTAVGKSTVSGANQPVAQRWNGTSWSEQAAAKKSGSTHNRLLGVDCPSETRCIAVGNYQNSEGGPATLGEIWNEGSWKVQSTPVPSGATSSELVAVGCRSTANCVGVGSAVIGGVKSAIAERWDSPTWTLESIPIPEGATSSQLDGVDCIWSNFCVAVGRYTTSGGTTKSLAMFWNGTSWSLQTLTDPAGAAQSTLLDVSCTKSPSVCTAVGGWKNSALEQFTLAYRFTGGSTWTLQSTPNPSGSIASVFQDVSCATEASCTAVGSWISSSGGSNQTLAEEWDGSSWSIEGTPNPSGATFSAFFGVSCRSVTCMGVGWSTDGTGVDTPLAETSDLSKPPTVTTKSASDVASTNATLKGSINPNSSETTYQFEYGTTTEYGSKAPASPKSTGSGTSPVEVSEKIEGLAPETTYHFRLVATNTKGTTKGEDQTFTTTAWEILSTPNPEGASDGNLYDVSCEPSTSVCTSVGTSTISGADSPIAQRWNGTAWSEQAAAKKSGATHSRLFGVDCPSETRCIAVGNYQSSEGPATLGELWNEGSWKVQSTPIPSGATSSELVAVGCSSTATCGAVGSAVIGGVKTAIAEKWNSPTWSLESIPIPEGATSSQLDGVDCIWSNFCLAVGRYTAGGSTKVLAMFWNGTSWSLQTLTDPAGAAQSTLLDVSCTKSPSVCTAVGGWKNSGGEQFTLAYRFTGGSTWTLQNTPNPSGATESLFQDVSCATETSCTAVGSSVSGGSTKTLAEKWNGTSWSIQGTPNPSGSTFSSLFGVSCQSTTCMGVGWSTDGSGVDTTLAEIRE
jgi:subtilisin family serine protease